MSNPVVLNIPLQNTLTPTVGSYSGEGRTDTTFDYDSNTGEYSLYAGSEPSPKGYYYYTPSKEVSLEEVEIDLDVKSESNLGKDWILMFNAGQSNYWGIQKHMDIGIWLNYQSTEKYISTLGSIPLNTWVHINIKFTQEDTTTHFIVSKDNGTPTEFDVTNKDFSINTLSVLGSNNINATARDYYIKNIQIKAKSTEIPRINFHIGNEVCRAYSILPEVTSKGILNWQYVTVTPTNNKTPLIGSIPLQGVTNKNIYFKADWYMSQNDSVNEAVFAFNYDEDMEEYALTQLKYYTDSGRTAIYTFYAESADIWGLDSSHNTITLEYKFKITNIKADMYRPTTAGDKVCLLNFDCTSDPTDSSNYSEIYLYSDGTIAERSKTSAICTTETQYASNFTLEQGVVYKVTFIATRNPIKDTVNDTYVFTYEVYINDVLFYVGTRPRYKNVPNLEAGSFYFNFTTSYEAYILKNIGSIKVFVGRPQDKYKIINLIKDATNYYLLAGNNCLYPSTNAKAKIDGITYSILLKHNEDNI